MAGKADGLILHDRMLSPVGITKLAGIVPIVTLAGNPTSAAMNVRCDNESGIRALVRHLVIDHGYRSVGYLSGRGHNPDNRARARGFEGEGNAAGADAVLGPLWQGDRRGPGEAGGMTGLLGAGARLPRALLCPDRR